MIINTIMPLCRPERGLQRRLFGGGNTTYSNDAALFYVIYLFQQAFEFLHMGYASALAWLLFVIIMGDHRRAVRGVTQGRLLRRGRVMIKKF